MICSNLSEFRHLIRMFQQLCGLLFIKVSSGKYLANSRIFTGKHQKKRTTRLQIYCNFNHISLRFFVCSVCFLTLKCLKYSLSCTVKFSLLLPSTSSFRRRQHLHLVCPANIGVEVQELCWRWFDRRRHFTCQSVCASCWFACVLYVLSRSLQKLHSLGSNSRVVGRWPKVQFWLVPTTRWGLKSCSFICQVNWTKTRAATALPML